MSTGNVLFVDDEENILNSLRRGLIDEDYQCFFCTNGKDALEVIKNKKISVIVSDMRMPGMDGLTLLKEVREISPNTIRIVLSGYTQLQQILATINQVDIFKFITKPWKLEEEFKVVIEQALEYYNLRMESENLKKVLENRNIAYQNMIKSMNDKIDVVKNERDIIREISKNIVEHMFISMEKESDINFEFERGFWKLFSENLILETKELNVVNAFDKILESLVSYNKNIKIEKKFKFPPDYKIKTNKSIFDMLIEYILIASINFNDSYTIHMNGDLKYILDKDIIEFIFILTDLKNEEKEEVPSFNNFITEKIDFINKLMNEYLKFYNGKFEIKSVKNKLLFKIQLINNRKD